MADQNTDLSAVDPPPRFDPPPAYPSRRGGAPGAPRRRGLLWALAALAAAALAAGGYVVLSSGSSGPTSPQAAVSALLDAGMHNDVKKADGVLCADDRKAGQLTHLASAGRISRYQLGAQTTENGIRFVSASYSTSAGGPPTTEQFPVVREGGSWKVCFSRVLAAAPTPGAIGGIPSNIAVPPGSSASGVFGRSGTHIALPSGAAASGLCTGYTSGFGAAQTYVGAAEIGAPTVAQACVYQNRVPLSVAQRLDGTLFTPVTVDQNALVIEFRSADDRTHVSVTTAREPDGRYWVVAVTVH